MGHSLSVHSHLSTTDVHLDDSCHALIAHLCDYISTYLFKWVNCPYMRNAFKYANLSALKHYTKHIVFGLILSDNIYALKL